MGVKFSRDRDVHGSLVQSVRPGEDSPPHLSLMGTRGRSTSKISDSLYSGTG